MKKIVIGTANFNTNYGIKKYKFQKKEIQSKLLNFLKKQNIKYLDTAFDYKLTNNFVKDLNFKNFKIVTKFKLPKKKPNLYLKNFEKIVKKQKKIYNIKSFEAILLHDVNDLKTHYSKKVIEKLIEVKKKRLVKNIGVSIYDTNDLNFVFSKFSPDIIQLPLNVFDQRFLKSKWLRIIKNKRIKVQARSIFLQGSLLMKQSELQKSRLNTKLIDKIKIFENWCKNKNITRLEACINYVKHIKYIDHIILGINNNDHLIEILKALKIKKKFNLTKFAFTNKNLIDPRKW